MANVPPRVVDGTPLERLFAAAGVTLRDAERAAGVDPATLRRIVRAPSAAECGTSLAMLLRCCAAWGVAPAEAFPELAVRPRSGLFYDRGFFRLKR